MTHKSITPLVLSLLWGVGLGNSAGAAQAYLVPKAGFDCFLNNIKAYQASSDDPVIVYFRICPRVELTAKDLQGSTLDALPKPGSRAAGAKNVITLTKQEIECIAAGKIDIKL